MLAPTGTICNMLFQCTGKAALATLVASCRQGYMLPAAGSDPAADLRTARCTVGTASCRCDHTGYLYSAAEKFLCPVEKRGGQEDSLKRKWGR